MIFMASPVPPEADTCAVSPSKINAPENPLRLMC